MKKTILLVLLICLCAGNAWAQYTGSAAGAEVDQLATMDSTTVSAGQWVFVGAADQAVKTSDSPQFTGVNIGHATDTTLTRSAAGVLLVEGNAVPEGPAAGPITFTGPTAARSYALPDAAATIVYSGGALGTPSSGKVTV